MLGKRIGAYSSGCYDTNPYILMNFIGDYNSLSTMIHELGHSAHSYLSCHHQSPVNCDYRIFVAEVASTVNETLLINYMLDHASSEKKKAYFLYELLENCVGLISDNLCMLTLSIFYTHGLKKENQCHHK